jgi:hypothetical protein
MPAGWPPLPMIEITVIGEKAEHADLVQALTIFLAERLASVDALRDGKAETFLT